MADWRSFLQQATMPTDAEWLVTIAPDRAIDGVAVRLAECGFEVTQVFAELGVIAGRCSSGLLPRMRALDCVVDIAPDASVRAL